MQKLYHLNLKAGEIGRYALLPGDPGRCERIARHLEQPRLIAQNREFTVYAGGLRGQRVSVCSTGIGGPSAAIAVEELHMAGADTFVRVGTCGGIAQKVRGGDMVIGLAAVRQEGTGLHYMPVEFPACADFAVTQAIAQAAARAGRPFHIGVVQSKDSFYGQHAPERMPVEGELKAKWEAWRRGGVLASEMEAAAVFVVAATLSCRAGAILHCVWNTEAADFAKGGDLDDAPAVETAVRAMELLIERDGEAVR